jgi:hypothetical protein
MLVIAGLQGQPVAAFAREHARLNTRVGELPLEFNQSDADPDEAPASTHQAQRVVGQRADPSRGPGGGLGLQGRGARGGAQAERRCPGWPLLYRPAWAPGPRPGRQAPGPGGGPGPRPVAAAGAWLSADGNGLEAGLWDLGEPAARVHHGTGPFAHGADGHQAALPAASRVEHKQWRLQQAELRVPLASGTTQSIRSGGRVFGWWCAQLLSLWCSVLYPFGRSPCGGERAACVRRDAGKPCPAVPAVLTPSWGNPSRLLYPHDHAGLYRCCLWWCGGHRPPSPWALLDIGVVGLGVLAIVPI